MYTYWSVQELYTCFQAVVYAFNANSSETGKLICVVRGQPILQSKFQDSLGYVERSRFKINQNKEKTNK